MSQPELAPHLLYRVAGNQAHFATWRLNTGHESLALFSTVETARKYRSELRDATQWQLIEPARDKLLDIFQACRASGILYAALDPAEGSARTLFDLPQVLAAAIQLPADR